MTLPIDLVFVRHGQSEGNAGKDLPMGGGPGSLSERFAERHSASLRLTEKGRGEARETGVWLQNEFFEDGSGFGKYFVSDYTRAMETAALLDLPDAHWYRSFYLVERDWGDIDKHPGTMGMDMFKETLRRRQIEPFFWRAVGGERFVEKCHHNDRFLDSLHRECENMRVLVVCHGEVMYGFRVLLEKMAMETFKEIYLSKSLEHKIFNGEVHHYSRRDPETGDLSPHIDWVRIIRPTVASPCNTLGWRKIERPEYTNEELLELVSRNETILE